MNELYTVGGKREHLAPAETQKPPIQYPS